MIQQTFVTSQKACLEVENSPHSKSWWENSRQMPQPLHQKALRKDAGPVASSHWRWGWGNKTSSFGKSSSGIKCWSNSGWQHQFSSTASLPGLSWDTIVDNFYNCKTPNWFLSPPIDSVTYPIFLFFNPHQRKCLLIRDRERETLIGCFLCMSLLGIEPTTFWCTVWCSNQPSHLTRVTQYYSIKFPFCLNQPDW